MQRTALVEEDKAHEPSSATVSGTQQNTALCQEGAKKRKGGLLAQPYEGFLVLPVPVVLAVLWLWGVALMSACGVALYLLWLSLQAL